MHKNLKIILLVGVFLLLGGVIFFIAWGLSTNNKSWSVPTTLDLRSEVVHLAHTAPSFAPSEDEFLELDRIIREEGLAHAWKFLKEKYEGERGLVGNPHFLAHFFGRRAYETFGIDGVRYCDESFAHGCYHGVFSEVVREKVKKA